MEDDIVQRVQLAIGGKHVWSLISGPSSARYQEIPGVLAAGVGHRQKWPICAGKRYNGLLEKVIPTSLRLGSMDSSPQTPIAPGAAAHPGGPFRGPHADGHRK